MSVKTKTAMLGVVAKAALSGLAATAAVASDVVWGLLEKYQPGLFSEGVDIAQAWAIFIAEDA